MYLVKRYLIGMYKDFYLEMKVIEIRYCGVLRSEGNSPPKDFNTVKSTSFNSSLGSNLSLCCALRPRWTGGKVSTPRSEGSRLETRFHRRTAVQGDLMHAKSFGPKCPPASAVRKLPDQVSTSSSDRGSKLRAPSQNSSRLLQKRDVNITN
ncbi:hypothetical protein AVEN_152912-1 [Araneus ventricosus]|uniref:Uncharacterized protein n=1 Tax=Araneus ventricosus TaxID=182803 RepID=A0A4Y2AD50_ARAVE|nr:hypothetical protein AVEN_152912-1 [Araneus ventricosus]